MTGDRVLEISFKPVLLRHSEKGFFAMRCRPLGLTGFGTSAEEALESLSRLLESFVVSNVKLDRLDKIMAVEGISCQLLNDAPAPEAWREVSKVYEGLLASHGQSITAPSPITATPETLRWEDLLDSLSASWDDHPTPTTTVPVAVP